MANFFSIWLVRGVGSVPSWQWPSGMTPGFGLSMVSNFATCSLTVNNFLPLWLWTSCLACRLKQCLYKLHSATKQFVIIFTYSEDLKLVSCCAIANSPSCMVNLLRSCWTVIVSGGDPTDQWVVPFELHWVSIGCIAMTSALEPE
jgi:hypothetical protein